VGRIDTSEARRLLDAGALPVEVLPESDYRREHLPGAVSVPLDSLTAEAVADLDRDRAVVVYCYDAQCDLSARGAARFEQLGFAGMVDEAGAVPCGPDPEPIVREVLRFAAAGFDRVYVHQIGPDQEGFLRYWSKEIAPLLAPGGT
jgi:rhodanese-related sulfurtransferase